MMRRLEIAAGLVAHVCLCAVLSAAVPTPAAVAEPSAARVSPAVTAPRDVVALQSASLPAFARRIASLDDLSTELLVSLGVAPVAVANLESYRRYVKIGADLLVDSAALGSPQQPDLEALVRLKPDLIVGVSYLHLPLFHRLQRIAPTLVFQVSLSPGSMDGVAVGEAMLTRLGELTGRDARAREILALSHAALARTRQVVAEHGLGGKPLVPLYPLSREGSFIVSNQHTLIASLVSRLGVTNPWQLDSAYSLHRRIGLREVAARKDLTALFIGGQEQAPMFATPLWHALPVAREGRYGFLPSPYWTFGGPLSVVHLADQIAEAVRAMPAVTR